MDRQVTGVGDEGTAIEPRPEVLGRLSKPIRPMRRLFGPDAVDRRLVRAVVRAFTVVKGLEYEETHQLLSAGAEKIEFECPDVTPDYLLRHKERESRIRLRKRINERGLLRSKFVDTDDGAGFRDLDPPKLDDDVHDRSMRGVP